MNHYKATGSFDVVIKPQGEPDTTAGAKLGRMSIDKQFHGDLSGVGKGEMLSALTDTEGSAGYVAIERVVGTLHGRRGSFVFQHTGTMNRGAQQLSISVVPDSGSGELTGLSGIFLLTIEDGNHLYTFEYSLPGIQREAAGDLPTGLAAPAQRALAGAGIQRLDQLARISEAELKKLHGIGPKAVEQLRQALHARGLSFPTH
ncbi:MAG: DUF3224 domain-containing protein [Caldilineaceae bacterium]|nr:DUF3224 domain-containing protein [Caldilineaceae bacterium]